MRNDIISVGNRRLLKLAELLESLPPERFNYGHWVGENYKGRANLSCGTTACALGWATTMPSLRKLGFRLKQSQVASGKHLEPVVIKPLKRTMVARDNDPDDTDLACNELFGLDMSDVMLLFIPNYNYRHTDTGIMGLPRSASAKAVAGNIRMFVASSKRAFGRT